MTDSKLVSNAPIVVLAVCALFVSGLLARREFWGRPAGDGANDPWAVPLRKVANWATIVGDGERANGAPVTIVIFGDLQCPACRNFELGALRSIELRYGQQVDIVRRHFPLTYHPWARAAAVASECAREQASFEPFYALVLKQQDSLPTKSLGSFGAESGVRDRIQFEACLTAPAALRVVESDLALGATIPVRGTPTVLVNGYLLPTVPDETRLDSVVRAVLPARGR